MRKQRRRSLWLALALGTVLLVGYGIFLLVACWRGEAFYRNRPTSYWRSAVMAFAWGTNSRRPWGPVFDQDMLGLTLSCWPAVIFDGSPDAVPVLRQLLTDPHSSVRFYAVDGLTAVGMVSNQVELVVPLFEEALADEDGRVRRYAILGLGRFASQSERARAALVRCLRCEDMAVARIAIEAVDTYRVKDEAIELALCELLKNDDYAVKEESRQALSHVAQRGKIRRTPVDGQ